MQRSYYTTPKPSRLMRLFWKAAGADQYILERSTYSDQIKYVCMGGIVIATGGLAGLAGGYAFYTIFNPLKGDAMVENIHIPTVFTSIIFGMIWGLIIFNLDRFIVTSTGKGDGTEAITKQEFKSALPRIIMGMIIAITISKPIEIRMFQSEINVAVAKVQQDSLKRFNDDTRKEFDIAINEIDKKNVEYKSVLRELKSNIDNLQDQFVAEARIITVGPRAKAVKVELNKLEMNYQDQSKILQPKIDDLDIQRKSIERIRDLQLQKNEEKVIGYDGLLLRIKMAHKEAGMTISFFITLLFMAIELTPIFFKLMLTKGPYDYIDENIKELIKAENGIQVQYNYYKDKQGQERDLIIHHQVDRLINDKVKILEAQKELSDEAIGIWKEQQRGKMNNNLNDFIKEEPDNA